MSTRHHWPWIALVGCVPGVVLVLAALAQEAEPPVPDVPDAEAFQMLGALGDGIHHTYADIPFRFADDPIRTQLLMVGHVLGITIPRDELPLAGQVTRAVHLMVLTAFSLETPHGTPAGAIHVVYEDRGREVVQMFEGVDVAEWSYGHPVYGRRLAHEPVPPAYVWSQDDPEVGEYGGYAFYVAVETDPRPLARLELELSEAAAGETPGGNFLLMVSAVTLELAEEEE